MTGSSDERSSDDVPNGSFGAELRRFRQTAGMSLTDLSAKTHYSRGYLSKIENGHVLITRKIAQAADDAVGARGALVRLIEEQHAEGHRVTMVRMVDLPPSTGWFHGREKVQAEIVAVLTPPSSDQARVIVIYGLPGAGKTELAVQAAGQVLGGYDDGCLFVDLHGVTEALTPADVMNRILRRLGLPGELIPHEPDEQAALYRRTVRERRLLLVFDNAGSVGQVAPLLPPGGLSDVIVTSRNRLPALDEACHVLIGALDRVPARRLFLQIAGIDALDPRVEDQVDQITRRCGWLPLAIRVAAARLRGSTDLGLDVLDRQLDDEASRLTVLEDGERSVGAAFGSALAALPAELARTLALLTVHPGDDLDHRSAALLSDVDTGSARLLDGLVDACLLHRQRRGRYAFHDLVRSFATPLVGSVVPRDEADCAADRLVSGFLHIAQHADLTITPNRFRASQVTPVAARWYAIFKDDAAAQWFDDEQHNLVHMCELAMAQGRPDLCWRLAYTLRDFYFRTKLWTPWIRTHEIALDAAGQCDDRWAVAVTRNNLGLAYAETERYGPAVEQYGKALELFHELNDGYGEANTIGHQAWVMHCLGRHRTAIRQGLTALWFYEAHGMRRNAAITLRTVALAEAALRNFDTALGYLQRALQVFTEEGLVLDETMTLNCLGEVYARAPDPAGSTKHFRAARRRGRDGGSTFEQARALRGLAAVATAAGRPAEAARLIHQAQALHAGYRLVPRQSGDDPRLLFDEPKAI